MRHSIRTLAPILAGAVALGAVWIANGSDSDPVAPPAAPTAANAEPAEAGGPEAAGAKPVIAVYKSPTCGCCSKWVDHLREHGFEVVAHDTEDMGQVKATSGIPGELATCHTAIVDGYVVEGHVPADAILRLLEERPDVAGLAVPGMPMGSPGMEGPYTESYDVLAFDRDGRTRVFESR